MTDEELDVLHEPRFVDWAPAQVWAQLRERLAARLPTRLRRMVAPESD